MAGKGRGCIKEVKQVTEEEDDEESEELEEDEDSVAFLEDPPASKNEERLLTRRMFPSKLGGKPAWLVPRQLPSAPNAPSSPAPGADAIAPPAGEAAELECRRCGRPLRFLLQIYASRECDRPEAFHRGLHLFVCTSCQPNEARLFRAQLPQENEFYSSDRPNEQAISNNLRKKGDRDPTLDQFCCGVCGLPRSEQGAVQHPASAKDSGGAKKGIAEICQECARRKRNGEGPAIFQERELRTEEAEIPEEEDDDGVDASGSGCGESEEVEEVFTPGAAEAKGLGRDLVAEADIVLDSARRKGASAAVLEKLEEYKAKAAESSEHLLDGSEQQVFDEYCKEKGVKDEVFSTFNRFAAANNGHVVRYNFGGQPLWFCTPGRPDGSPPPCQNCGAPRVFEFQVQPQLIALLSGTTDVAQRLDFGTICCFVCKRSCTAPDSRPYLEEFVCVQGEPHEAWLPRA